MTQDDSSFTESISKRQKRKQFRKERRNAPLLQSNVTIAKISPLSAIKITFIYSLFIAICLVVASFFAWQVFEKTGLVNEVNSLMGDLTIDSNGSALQLEDYIDTPKVMMYSISFSIVLCLLATLFAGIGSFLYNNTNRLIGGLEVTLSQPDVSANVEAANQTQVRKSKRIYVNDERPTSNESTPQEINVKTDEGPIERSLPDISDL